MAARTKPGATATAWALLLTVGQALAQCSDPLDSTLCVHRLSPADSASFSTTDGQVSAFWANWAGRDSIELTSERNCCRANSSCACVRTDNRVVVKAACDASGLYLLVVVEDSVVLDRAGNDDWGTDAVDMYFDALPSGVLDTCTTCLAGIYSTSLTYTTFQQYTWLGNASVTGISRVGGGCPYFWDLPPTNCAWSQCGPPWNLRQEVVLSAPHCVAAEYYAPWWWYSWKTCDSLRGELAGKRLAFMIGYNDRDSPDDSVTCLRWQHGDPWTPREPGESHWGDLLLPQDLVPLATADRAAPIVRSPAAPVSPERFTLSGKRIRPGIRSHGVLTVQRAGHGANTARIVVNP